MVRGRMLKRVLIRGPVAIDRVLSPMIVGRPPVQDGGRMARAGFTLRQHGLLCVGAALCVVNTQSIAQSSEIQWAVIGDPGNRMPTEEEIALPPHLGWDPDTIRRSGAVDHIYRIGITEVTVGQWKEFIEAYARITSLRMVLILSLLLTSLATAFSLASVM
jgi:hypothetical protein